MNKICKVCNVEMGIEQFYTHPLTKDGYMGKCKLCISTYNKSIEGRKRQAIYDSIRNEKPDRKALKKKLLYKFRELNPEKWGAHKMVSNFLKKNGSFKPSHCAKCGIDGLLHYHHFDYSKPNEVIPCCPLCHSSFHKGNTYEWMIKHFENHEY